VNETLYISYMSPSSLPSFPPRYKWKDGRWLSDAVNDYLHVPIVILSIFYKFFCYTYAFIASGFVYLVFFSFFLTLMCLIFKTSYAYAYAYALV